MDNHTTRKENQLGGELMIIHGFSPKTGSEYEGHIWWKFFELFHRL